MTTIIDPGETAVSTHTVLATPATDLITAIQDVVGPDNDCLVVSTVVHMLHTGSIPLEAE